MKNERSFWIIIIIFVSILVFLYCLRSDTENLKNSGEDLFNYPPLNQNYTPEAIIEEVDNFQNTNLLHWGHMPITYTIKDNANCSGLQINKIINSLRVLENKTNYIQFVEVNSSNADIIIQCIDIDAIQKSYFAEINRLKKDKSNCIERFYNHKKDSISTYAEGILNKSEHLFINASKKYIDSNTIWAICYINVSDISYENIQNYGIEDWEDISNSVLGDARPIIEGDIIKSGKINLYKPENGWSVCTDFPAKEMHELLHLFGFGHVEEPYWDPYKGYAYTEPLKDIMFPRIYCTFQKEVQQKYLSCLDYIYSDGKVGFCSTDVNFISSEAECPPGLYLTIDDEFCCPEPNMIVINEYCYSN